MRRWSASSRNSGIINLDKEKGEAISECDLMHALSEVPPMRLASVDEAFQLLDSGLGAVFCASMARRAAVHRAAQASSDSKEKPSSGAEQPTKGSAAGGRARKAAPKGSASKRTAGMLQRAVRKLSMPARRLAAQQVTMQLFEAFSNEERAKAVSLGFELAAGASAMIEEEENEDGSPKAATSRHMAPPPAILQDPEFQTWAAATLGISLESIDAWSGSPRFLETLNRQMLRWPRMRVASKFPTPMRSERSVALAAAAKAAAAAALAEEEAEEEEHSAFSSGLDAALQQQRRAQESGALGFDRGIPERGASPLQPAPATALLAAARALLGGGGAPSSAAPPASSAIGAAGGSAGAGAAGGRAQRRPSSASSSSFSEDEDASDSLAQEEGERRHSGSAAAAASLSVAAGDHRSLRARARAAAAAASSARQRSGGGVRRGGRGGFGLGKSQSDGAKDDADPRFNFSAVLPGEVAREDALDRLLSDDNHDGGVDDGLPSLPSFIAPVGGGALMSSDKAGAAPEFAYLRRCELLGLVPCQSAWRRFGGGQGIVDIGHRSLADTDVAAVVETAVECAALGRPFKVLDLSGCALTDAGLERVAGLLEAAPEAVRAGLKALSIADSAQLRMRSPTLLEGLGRALPSLASLASLDLSGLALRGAAAVRTASALATCSSLRVLNLAGCGLGATDQADCVAVAALLGPGASGTASIESADFSNNLFSAEGFAAAASALRSSKVKSLSFAGNSVAQVPARAGAVFAVANSPLEGSSSATSCVLGSSFVGGASLNASCGGTVTGAALASSMQRGGAGAGGGRGSARDGGACFHPIQLLIEGLLGNQTLERIDFSSCKLGPDTAFVLESALHSHRRIKAILLNDNPLGDAGLRSVVRLLISIRSDVGTCDIRGHRESDAVANRVRFRFSQPGGSYALNLALPSERAVLRTLLRHTEKLRGSTFRHFKFDARTCQKPSVDYDADGAFWSVPTSGQIHFAFNPPLSDAARHVLQDLGLTEVGLSSSFRAGAGAGAKVGIAGGSAGLGATRGARGTLAAGVGLGPASRGTVVAGGGGAGPGGGRQSAWVSSTTAGGAIDRPLQLKSTLMTHARTTPVAASSDAASDGASGAPSAVSAPRSAAAAEAAASTPEGDWAEMASLLKDARILVSALRFPLLRGMLSSLITDDQQLRFVRACSRDLWFNAAQVQRLCDDKPEIAAEVVCALFPSVRGRSSQLMLLGSSAATNAPGIGGSRKVPVAVESCLWFQEGNVTGRYVLNLAEPADCVVAENCLLVNAWESEVTKIRGRPDVSQRGGFEMIRNEEHDEVPFVFGRDWALPNGGVLSFDYSSSRRPRGDEAAMSEATEVTKFLKMSSFSSSSKLKALKAISVHMYLSAQQFRSIALCFREAVDRQDAFCTLHTRVVDPDSLLGPMVLYSDAVFRDADRAALLRRIGHLHLLNPLHPDHIPYRCRLAVYEERRVVEMLVQLSIHEAGAKVLRELEDGHTGVVPASWADKGVPSDGTLVTCSYETQTVNAAVRQQLGAKYCVGVFASGTPN